MHAIALTNGTIDEEQYANIVRKLLKRIYPVSWRVLIAAAEADWRGRAVPGAQTEPYEAGNLFIKAVLTHEFDKAPPAPLVLGRDLIALGLEPGPKFGRLIERIEEERDRGRLTTREEAIQYLKTLI